MSYYITHIVNQEPPQKGFRKVSFYTKDLKNGRPGEYFLGTDNNPLESSYIENLVIKQKIIRLITPVEIKEDITLYCDHNNDFYLANYLKDRVNISFINNKNKNSIGDAIRKLKNNKSHLKFETMCA